MSIRRAALQPNPAEEVLAQVGHHQKASNGRAGTLAEDGDAFCAASKRLDVVVNPLQSDDRIHQAEVAFDLAISSAEEAKGAKAIAERYHDHASLSSKGFAIVDPQWRAAVIVGATKDPDLERRG